MVSRTPKTALITGVAGFIGSHLTEALLTRGWNVLGLDNLDPFYSESLKQSNLENIRTIATQQHRQFDFYKADILTDLKMIPTDQTVDLVVHLAAKAGVRPSIEHPRNYFQTNVTGTVEVLEWCKKHQVKNIFFASSSSVYGNDSSVPFSEEARCDQPVSPYAASKRAAELICHTYSKLYGFKIGIARYFTVYGPRQRPDLAIAKFSNLIQRGQPIPFYGDGSAERDHTEITDIVQGSLRLIQWIQDQEDNEVSKGIINTFNLGGSNTTSLSRLVEILEKSLNKKAQLAYLPDQPGDVKITFANIEKSQRILGYTPEIDIESGIKRYCEWLKTTPQN